MKQIIKNFNKYKFLLSELVVKEIKLKYRRSYLGILWTLLEPLLTMLVLTMVFENFYGRKDNAFPIYVLTGRLLYAYFSNATKSAMKSIRTNGQMIKKVYVPKYIYPLSSILSQFVTFLISLIVLVGVAIVLKIRPTIYLLEAIVPLLILFVMVLGIGLILATLAVFFRDMEYLWGVILMLIMYCSAIFYDPTRVIKTGYGWILTCNPLYSVIVNFRNTVIYGIPLDRGALVYSSLFSVIALIIGIWMFYKKQDEFILNI
ncbi:MAG TPA: ABC transporter permease [Mobilitalea sp.]|nr:ABC transporter permease [Mobilitalea sp.]